MVLVYRDYWLEHTHSAKLNAHTVFAILQIIVSYSIDSFMGQTSEVLQD